MKLSVVGHSGCDIKVIREENNLFIYKSTRDPKYFNRLVLQAEKQEKASHLKMQYIRVPKIHKIIETTEQVGVKMDYVYSKNFVEFFEHAGFEQVNYLIGALIMFLEKEISDSTDIEIPRDIIIDKFEDVRIKTLNNNNLKSVDHFPKIEKILSQSEPIFYSLPSFLNLPIGSCHGDLTFSNILFNGNNYYLIDFLDSFIESPLLDIVKIRQDSAWQWSRLMFNGACDNIRLKIAFSKIDKEIDAHFDERYSWYREFYKPMQLMNFLRILQYAHEKDVIDYLISSLESQLFHL